MTTVCLAPAKPATIAPEGDKAARRPYLVIGAATLAFVTLAVLLSLATGAPFTLPTERMSRAIGVNYMVPFCLGIAGYCLAQLLQLLVGRRQAARRSLRGNLGCDLYFMALFVIVIYVHFHVKMWMPVVNPAVYDAMLLSTDNELRGLLNLVSWLRMQLATVIPAADDWYQVGFFLMFGLTLWFHSVGERRYHLHNVTAILLLEMIGAFSYLIMPAVGPFIYEPGLNTVATEAQQSMYVMFRQVQEFGVEWLKTNGGQYFTGPPAAMPSLHVAGAIVMTYYTLKARSVVAPLMLMLSLWIVIESLAARWHYAIDLPAGAALALAVMLLANRICRTRPASDPSPVRRAATQSAA